MRSIFPIPAEPLCPYKLNGLHIRATYNFLAIHVLPATIYARVPIAAHYTLRFLMSLLERALRTPLAYSRNPPSEPTPQN